MSRDLVTALVVALAISVGYSLFYRHSRGEWEAEVEVALSSAKAWEAQASVYAELADSAEAKVVEAEARVTERVRVVRERVVEVREVEVPAIAQPFVAERDAIIDELLVAFDEVDDILEGYVTVVDFLRQEAWAYEVRGDSLEAVLLDRPGPRKWWVPQTGVGAFVGMCQSGGICSGVGLTFSWSL